MKRRTHTYRFSITCVECPGPDPGKAITDMVEAAKEVTRGTFVRQVHTRDREFLEQQLGYTLIDTRRGLHMKDDPHVKYYKSTFRGKPCYYFVWSAIEYIFIRQPV